MRGLPIPIPLPALLRGMRMTRHGRGIAGHHHHGMALRDGPGLFGCSFIVCVLLRTLWPRFSTSDLPDEKSHVYVY